MYRKIALSFISVSLCVSPLGAFAQGVRDCRAPEDYPPLAGHWQDDLNGQEVDITSYTFAGDVLHDVTGHRADIFTKGDSWKGRPFSVLATYSSKGKTCKNTDRDGNDVPFQIDFKGDSGDQPHQIRGTIYWCDTEKREGQTYTTGIGSGFIALKESKDGMTLSGYFNGRNGRESISFTRLSKLEGKKAQVVVRTRAGAKIYQEPSTDSRVRYTPASGVKVIIVDAKLDADGNATWYAVSNGEGSLGGVGGPNSGWIPAGKVICSEPSQSGPVSVLRF